MGRGIRRMKEIFSWDYGAEPVILRDIGMEAKGLAGNAVLQEDRTKFSLEITRVICRLVVVLCGRALHRERPAYDGHDTNRRGMD